MATPFGSMSIGELQAGLTAKEFSAAEVARGTFERIEAADGVVHSFLETTETLALDAAARIGGPSPRGAWPRWGLWPACLWATRTT